MVPTSATCPIPVSIKYEAASVLPLSVSTAAAELYQHDYLALPLSSTSPKKTGKTLLVWGGSSSVGSTAIQLATASGLKVVTTASVKNFEYCKLGAKEVFHYSSKDIVAELVAAMQVADLAGAYNGMYCQLS